MALIAFAQNRRMSDHVESIRRAGGEPVEVLPGLEKANTSARADGLMLTARRRRSESVEAQHSTLRLPSRGAMRSRSNRAPGSRAEFPSGRFARYGAVNVAWAARCFRTFLRAGRSITRSAAAPPSRTKCGLPGLALPTLLADHMGGRRDCPSPAASSMVRRAAPAST